MTELQQAPAAHVPGAPWDTLRLRQALRDRYCAPAWALIEEVGNGTGAKLNRYADAMAMSLWPSHTFGLELHGFEVKASRADWLNEVKQPEKADAFARYCDRWWLVIADASWVKPGELPPGWGVLAPWGSVLREVTKATLQSPQPVDRVFLAGLMRRVHESTATPRELEAAYDRGCKDGWTYAENAQPNLKRFRRRAQDLLQGAKAVLDAETRIWKHAPHEK